MYTRRSETSLPFLTRFRIRLQRYCSTILSGIKEIVVCTRMELIVCLVCGGKVNRVHNQKIGRCSFFYRPFYGVDHLTVQDHSCNIFSRY